MSLYVPSHFRAQQASALELMRAYPFALLVAVQEGQPSFSHLPLVIDQQGESVRLLGHLARANPQQAVLASNQSVTAIFRGPDAYVTPSWYTVVEAVPTWNYLVVHAHGTVHTVEEEAGKERILKALIDVHDPAYRRRWDQELSADYRSRMLRAIVGFEIEVKNLEAKFKLGQNRIAADRSGVLAGLEQGNPAQQELAQWMRQQQVGV